MKKAILCMALTLPLGIALNAACVEEQVLAESQCNKRFSKNFQNLIELNVVYNGKSVSRKPACAGPMTSEN